MKKIFFFVLLLISLKGFSQYPAKQTLGTDSTEVNIKGATKTKLINYIFTDTTAANLTRIRQYPAALIYTSSDNKLWLRNFTTTAWILQGGGSVLSSFDTTTIYQTINDISIFLGDTSFTNQFMPAGIVLDTTYFVAGTDDSVRAYVYTDSTVIYDTLGRSLLSSITNNITNILQIIDSARSDTSFYISTILNGDTLLKVRHDPNSRNDTIFFTMVPSNPTTDGYMPKEAWALFGTGQDGIISGGRVTWLTNYTYNVSEAYYRIDSVIYHSPSTDITLDAAHATLDRIDLFLLTTSNTAVKLTGTAGSGIPPDFDANLNIEASFALVTANTTAPVNTLNKWIYQENLGTAGGEFQMTSSTARINVNSTSLPDLGSKVIEATNSQSNDYFMATAPAGFSFSSYNVLSFRIRSKANWGNNKKLVIRPFSAPSNATGSNVVIGSGSYGFVSTNTTSYQTITIPLSHFGNMVNPNAFRFTQSNTSGTSGWRIDNIQFQNTVGSTTATDIYDLTKNATNDSFYFYKNGNIIRRLRDSIGSGGGSTDTTSLSNRINLKQNLITLTTTGSSGASTFNQGTGALNIPQYSGGGGGGIDSVGNPNGTDSLNNYSSGTPTLGYRVQRVINVMDYGATHDGRIIEDAAITSGTSTMTSASSNFTSADIGKYIQIQAAGTGGYAKVFTITGINSSTSIALSSTAGATVLGGVAKYGTDQTPFIQAAIYADSIAGGGTVYFPSGIYIIAGALRSPSNSQLVLPHVTLANNYTSKNMHITFRGETRGLYGSTAYIVNMPPYAGTTLLSFGTGSGFFPSVIGAGTVNSAVGIGIGSAVIDFTIEHMNIQVMGNTPTGAAMGAINTGQIVNLIVNDIDIEVDVPLFNSIEPTSHYAAIIVPQTSSGVPAIYNTQVSGFRYGFILGQHSALHNVSIFGCYYGIAQAPSNGCRTQLTAVTALGCVYGIASVINYPSTISLSSSLGLIEGDIEIEAFVGAKWYNYVAAVKDTANLLTGHLGYTMYDGSSFNSSGFLKTGGANLQCIAIDNPLATKKDAIAFQGANTYSTTFSAGAIPYTGSGAGNVLRGNNTKMVYDSTNDRVGLGLAAPLFDLDVTKSSASFVEINAKNTNAAGKTYFVAAADSVSTFLASYGSGGALPKLGSILSTRDLRIAASGGVNTGGTSKITFSPSGYDEVKASMYSSGRWVFGTAADDGVNQIQTAGSSLLPTIYGSGVPSGNLVLRSTSHATKGLITFSSTTVFDEVNNRIGIGTAAPAAALQIYNAGGANSGIRVESTGSGGYSMIGQYNSTGLLSQLTATDPSFSSGIFGGNQLLVLNYNTNGAVQIGGNGANGYLTIIGGGAERMRVASTGAIRFNTYGAGTITSDASGNLTSVSDERLKTNIRPYKTGLNELMNINPITYKWNTKSGNETKETYAGFSAQNVKANIPFGTGENDKGYLSLQDRAIIATLVNAVKEQQEQIEKLKREVKALKDK